MTLLHAHIAHALRWCSHLERCPIMHIPIQTIFLGPHCYSLGYN